MDATVIHDNDGVLTRELIHATEGALDKACKVNMLEGPFNDINIEDSI